MRVKFSFSKKFLVPYILITCFNLVIKCYPVTEVLAEANFSQIELYNSVTYTQTTTKCCLFFCSLLINRVGNHESQLRTFFYHNVLNLIRKITHFWLSHWFVESWLSATVPGFFLRWNISAPSVAEPKAPAKRSQHANATYRNIVGRSMLRAFGHPVATCWVLLAQIWPSNLSQHVATHRNTVAHTHAKCCAQQCCDMLCWHLHVAIILPGLNVFQAAGKMSAKMWLKKEFGEPSNLGTAIPGTANGEF